MGTFMDEYFRTVLEKSEAIRAANEELAKAFVDYMLSDDGQTLTSQIGYTPVKSGVAVPEGLRSIDEINLMTWDTQELYQNRDADKDQFTEMFQ